MADNVLLNAGSGGDTVAADDIAGVKHQRVKLSLGADGTAADAPVGGGVEAGTLRVTLASDSTGVLSVDDNGSSLTVDNGGTFAVQATLAAETTKVIGTVNVAAAQTLATVTTVSAVTAITNALPAGDNNIGNVDIASAIPAGTNNIGDVDVLSVVPGTGATALGKAEDAAHSSGDTGVMTLAVRRDADTTLAATDGDYVPLQCNAAGSLKVAITAGAGSGGTSIADGASFTRDTTSVTLAAAAVETSAPTLTNGDAAALSMTTGGALRVAVASGGVAGIAEDSASAGGEEGIMVLAVRRDSASSGVGADGDFAALSVTSDGSLRVSGGGGGTQYAVDTAGGGTDTGTLALAVRDDALATLTPVDGDYTQLRTNARGAQWVALDSTAAQTVSLAAGTNNVGDVDVLTVPADPFGANADAASATGSISAKLRFIASTGIPVTGTVTVGSHAVTNAGTFATQVDGAALTALQLIDNACIADDAAFTPATTGVHMAGFTADETATDSVDEGDGGAARMTLDRKQIVTPYAHAAAGGHSPFKSLDLDESEEEIKGSGGKLFWIHAINLAATKRYLKIYNNTAAGVTVGTTVPDLTFPIPTLADTNGAGFCLNFGDHGLGLGTGITVAATTGFADNDSGAPGANEVILNAGYL